MELLLMLSVSSFLSIFAMQNDRVIVDPEKPADSRKLCSVPRTFVNLTSYAGYLNVGKRQHDYLFFWFFVTKADSEKTPLIVWLQGQPGIVVFITRSKCYPANLLNYVVHYAFDRSLMTAPNC